MGAPRRGPEHRRQAVFDETRRKRAPPPPNKRSPSRRADTTLESPNELKSEVRGQDTGPPRTQDSPMRRFIAFGPAFVVLITVLVTLLAVPAAVRRIGYANTEATIRIARAQLDNANVL